MITVTRADPGDTFTASLLYRDLGRVAHDEMSHRIVAVDHGRCRLLANEPDLRSDVDPPALDALDVLRQAKDSVAVRAVQIGFPHELCHSGGIRCRKTDCGKALSREPLERIRWNAARGAYREPFPVAEPLESWESPATAPVERRVEGS